MANLNDTLGNAFNTAIDNIVKQTSSGFTRALPKNQSANTTNNTANNTLNTNQQEANFSNTPWFNMPYEG